MAFGGKLVIGIALSSAMLMGCEKATYKVSGEGTATITYKDGKLHTEKNVALPWSKVVRGSELSLAAEGQGQLQCEIAIEGGSTVGEFGTGSCSASKSR